MKIQLRAFDALHLTAVAVVWLASAATTYGAMTALASAARARADVVAQEGKTMPKIDRVANPLEKAELATLIQRLAVLHPSVSIQQTQNDNISVAIKTAADYSEWHAAIADLMQAGTAGTQVETVSICGANCAGDYCVAEFSLKKVRYTAG